MSVLKFRFVSFICSVICIFVVLFFFCFLFLIVFILWFLRCFVWRRRLSCMRVLRRILSKLRSLYRLVMLVRLCGWRGRLSFVIKILLFWRSSLRVCIGSMMSWLRDMVLCRRMVSFLRRINRIWIFGRGWRILILVLFLVLGRYWDCWVCLRRMRVKWRCGCGG